MNPGFKRLTWDSLSFGPCWRELFSWCKIHRTGFRPRSKHTSGIWLQNLIVSSG